MEKTIAVLITAPDPETAKILARALVDERLAACANMFPVRSIYRWKGKAEDQEEMMLVVKTRESALSALTERVRALHPYEVPEIIALPVIGGNEGYLTWVAENTHG